MTPLPPANLSLEGGVRAAEWHAEIPEATPWVDVLRPDFWVHVAGSLAHQARSARHQYINVSHAGDLFSGRLKVLAVLQGAVVVAQVAHAEIGVNKEGKGDVPAGFAVELRGDQKWSVLRKADREVVKAGLATRSEAVAWLAEHKRQLTA